MKRKSTFKTLGILISFSSILTFTDPNTWFNYLPVILALGIIIYILSDTLMTD